MWLKLKRSYSYLRPYWKLVAGTYMSMIGIMLFNMFVPQVIRWMIDTGIKVGQLDLLSWSVAGLLGLTLLKGVLTYLEGMWSETASQNVAYDLRNEIQRKLTRLSFSFHDQTETGELLSRAVQDVERIRFLTGRASLRVLQGVFVLVGTVVMLFWMEARLALLVTASLPFLVYQALYFGRRFRPLSLRIQKQLAVLTTKVEQNLRGSRVVKAFAQEEAEIERFERENDHWFDLSAESTRLQAIHIPLLFLIANIGTVFIIWYGGRLVIQGNFTLGELVAFTAYVSQLIEPVRRLGMIIPAIAIASSSAERIFEILDTLPDVQDAPDAYPLPSVMGLVRFEGVSFGYSQRQVLREITFEAQPGQVVALLGPTGSGKSTIVSLLPRFYDPTQGRIMVDGHDIRKITLNSLRNQIGIVLQEATLFGGTVRENIAFGRPEATEEEIYVASQAAQAHEFIIQMDKGYETRIGERGVMLSGGQKQRLAIARALLLNPRLLILDDATSSVDTETEHLIQLAFQRLMQGRTTFVIAHRLSTVKRADLILVMDQGQIVARGTHVELLQTSALYAEIYQRQLRPQESSPYPAGRNVSAGRGAGGEGEGAELSSPSGRGLSAGRGMGGKGLGGAG